MEALAETVVVESLLQPGWANRVHLLSLSDIQMRDREEVATLPLSLLPLTGVVIGSRFCGPWMVGYDFSPCSLALMAGAAIFCLVPIDITRLHFSVCVEVQEIKSKPCWLELCQS